jgi:hypothetical protein
MTPNVGSADRIVRFVVGLALVLVPLLTSFSADTAWLRWGMLVVGLVMIATAAMRFCPAYTLLGIRTCRTG